MFTIVMKFQRHTRNYAVYVDVTNEINKLYLPKGLPDEITLVDQTGIVQIPQFESIEDAAKAGHTPPAKS